jgi:hypothetical protein
MTAVHIFGICALDNSKHLKPKDICVVDSVIVVWWKSSFLGCLMVVYQLKRLCSSHTKMIANGEQVRTRKNALMACIKIVFCVWVWTGYIWLTVETYQQGNELPHSIKLQDLLSSWVTVNCSRGTLLRGTISWRVHTCYTDLHAQVFSSINTFAENANYPVVFLSFCRQMPQEYLKLGQKCFLCYSFFIINIQSNQCCIARDTAHVVTQMSAV